VAEDDGRIKGRWRFVSGTVSHRRAAGQQVEALAAAEAGAARRGRRVAAGLAVVVVVAAAAVAWSAGAFRSPGAPGPGQGTASVPTQAVTRRDLSATTPVNGTLGYSGSYTVTGQGGGTLTQLPAAGKVIGDGQVLYRVDNGAPVVLLYGPVPAWRTLDEGITGQDVSQLNHDLVRLGYADSADIAALGWDYFSWETRYGVEQLQSDLGISDPSGSLVLGQAVFEPEAIRVSQVTGHLGGPMSGPVLAATSARHLVTIALDASQQSEVKKGDRVSVTLPDGKTTPGVVSQVGTVATAPSSQGSGQGDSGGSATIPVSVTLTHPRAAGRLDQAPVTVNITTASVKNVLAVPVGALLARSPGGYVVEVAGPGNTRRYVPVTPGTFDDTSGLVQVTGALSPGQRVVVSAS
jgi:multidrug efflux pump subunit AcrA (membrane-fusion protein)